MKKNKPAVLANNNLIGVAETGFDPGPEEVYNVEAVEKRLAEVAEEIGGNGGGPSGSGENAVVYLGRIEDNEPIEDVLYTQGHSLAAGLFNGDDALKTGYTIRDGQDRDWRYVADDEGGGGGGGGNTAPAHNEWAVNPIPSQTINKVIYENNLFIAVGENGYLSSSSDGLNWIDRKPSGFTASLRDIIYTGGYFIAVGGSSSILYSTNGTSWSRANSLAPAIGTAYLFTGVASDGDNVLAVGRGTGFIAYTTLSNLDNWSVTGTTVGSSTDQDRFIAHSPAPDNKWHVANARNANGQAMLYGVTLTGGTPSGNSGATAGTGATNAWSYGTFGGTASALKFINGNFWLTTSGTASGGRIFRLPADVSQNITNQSVANTANVTPTGSVTSLWDIAKFGSGGVIAFGGNGKAYATTAAASVTPSTWETLPIGSPPVSTDLTSGALGSSTDTVNGTLAVGGVDYIYTRHYVPGQPVGGDGGSGWYLVGGDGQGGGGAPINRTVAITGAVTGTAADTGSDVTINTVLNIDVNPPISVNGNTISHLSTDGNRHVPLTNNGDTGKFLKSNSTPGNAASWSTIGTADISGLSIPTVNNPTITIAKSTTNAATTGSIGAFTLNQTAASTITLPLADNTTTGSGLVPAPTTPGANGSFRVLAQSGVAAPAWSTFATSSNVYLNGAGGWTTPSGGGGTITGVTAGGDLTGTYPNPQVALVSVFDTRNDDQPPSWYWANGIKTRYEFKNSSYIGFNLGTYQFGVLQTIIPWTDSTGGAITQAFYYNGRVWTRYSTSTSAWSAWSEIIMATPGASDRVVQGDGSLKYKVGNSGNNLLAELLAGGRNEAIGTDPPTNLNDTWYITNFFMGTVHAEANGPSGVTPGWYYLINGTHRYGGGGDSANYGYQIIFGPRMTNNDNSGIWSRVRAGSSTTWQPWQSIGGGSGAYLPLTGGTLTGDLRLQTGGGAYGSRLRFGDGEFVYLGESSDDRLDIHASNGIFVDSRIQQTGSTTQAMMWVTNTGATGYAVQGDANWRGVVGNAGGTNADAIGVLGQTQYGIGVHGYTQGFERPGVYGKADGAGGYGVYGVATAVGGIGVYAKATGANGAALYVDGSSSLNGYLKVNTYIEANARINSLEAYVRGVVAGGFDAEGKGVAIAGVTRGTLANALLASVSTGAWMLTPVSTSTTAALGIYRYDGTSWNLRGTIAYNRTNSAI